MLLGCTAAIEGGQLKGAMLALAYSRRSDALLASGRFDEAVMDRRRAQELNPANLNYRRRLLEAIEHRGDARLIAKKFRDAIEDYTIVFDGGAVSSALLEKRSEAYIRLGKVKYGIRDLARAIELAPDKQALIKRIALLYELEAAKARAAGDVDSTVNAIWNAFQRISSVAGECRTNVPLKRDIKDSMCQLKRHIMDVLVDSLLERVNERLKEQRYKFVMEDIDQILKYDAKNIRAMVIYAAISEDLHQFEIARATYDRVLSIEPRNREATQAIARLDQRQRNLVRLLQIELKRVNCDPGPIDGVWGAKSRAAVKRFNQFANLSLDVRVPKRSTVDAVSRFDYTVCIDFKPVSIETLGLTVRNSEDRCGVVVIDVRSGSRADESGLKKGMIICQKYINYIYVGIDDVKEFQQMWIKFWNNPAEQSMHLLLKNLDHIEIKKGRRFKVE